MTARLAGLLLALAAPLAAAAAELNFHLLDRTNLVAWCVVPFDAAKRGPEARAEMLGRLGFSRLAYDWRDEQIPTFDAEALAMRRKNIEMAAWWMPSVLNEPARAILQTIERQGIHPQLWVMHGDPLPESKDQAAKVRRAAEELRPVALEAARLGCKVALYNHGGWFGEPENQIAIIKALGLPNVGIVYNFHHGHDHIARFPALFDMMKPHLLALGLNGMAAGGDRVGRKILHLGEGDEELAMLRHALQSGWAGPVAILDHRPETDSEVTLRNNLKGLDWLIRELREPGRGGPRPFPALAPPPPAAPAAGVAPGGVSALPKAFGGGLRGGLALPDQTGHRAPPVTVELLARLDGASGFNILAAADEKRSAGHWEMYTYAGAGDFSVYLPGRGGEYRSGLPICDGQWRRVAMVLEAERLRLFINGKVVLDRPLPPMAGTEIPGGLAFGRLVEGGIGCDGEVANIRIRRGAWPAGAAMDAPLGEAPGTVGVWNFEPAQAAAPGRDPGFWAAEDPAARAALPEFMTLPAAAPESLTPAPAGWPLGAAADWPRSHADQAGTRYSRLRQIDRSNVAKLEPAWVYHSKDGPGNMQCNPVAVGGVVYAPTTGGHVVALDGRNGRELWRFKPEGRPAHRGLTYWKSRPGPDRLLFPAGDWLYALDPRDGSPVAGFGEGGRVRSGASVVPPVVHNGVVALAGFDRDVFGFDLQTGRKLWTFRTIPGPGEYGAETWDGPESGANCWGGMALDEERGLLFLSTGSPKPNFVGTHHRGDNLFANCVLALDMRTGERVWHFQEIRHDIWDLDIPAPPNLLTVARDGRPVAALAQVTKLGNTLLLDRATGKPLFPVRLRRAPVSKLAGERTAAHQPAIELPEPFARQEFKLEDVTTRTEEAREHVLNQVRRAAYGWFEPFEEGRPTVLYGIHGGAEWTGAAVDPQAGRLYVSANELAWIVTVYRSDETPRKPGEPPTRGETVYQAACASCHGANREGVGVAPPLQGIRHRLTDAAVADIMANGRNGMPAAPPMEPADHRALLDFLFIRDRATAPEPADAPPRHTHNGYPKLLDHEGYPGTRPPWGTLNALDLNTGRLLWKVPLGEHPELTAQGLPPTGTENFGGAIATAGGLVFCAGTRDEKIRAFDADTGAELWSHKLPWGGYAPPATYEIDGRQYVIIAATGGGKLGGPMGDAWVAFALPGS